MDFNYQKFGDILYGVETFSFRYQGRDTADIKLLNLLDDNQFAYEISMTSKDIPSDFKSISSSDSEIFKSFEIEFKPFMNDKQEALQNAIDIMSAVMIRLEEKKI